MTMEWTATALAAAVRDRKVSPVELVRESLARIEQIVWEVVPKLAESLIQEEIRRLKGESS